MSDYQFVGVDVAKDKLDIALYSQDKKQQHCFSNNKKGHLAFLRFLKKHTQTPWVCMEATGHYSELIADFLVKNEVPVSIVNPLQIKSFARAKLSRNKTDAIDAQIIADFCQKMRPRAFLPRSTSQKELKDLTKLLGTLKEQVVQLKNQLESTQGKFARKAIVRMIKELETEIARIENLLLELVKTDKNLDEKMMLITSIKGIGKLTAFKVLAHIPDIHSFSNAKQFAAFIGISPKQHQSGKFIGKTTISRLGDARLRKAFYMAALVAKRHNEALKPFVLRLQQKGKAPKSIICAVMRKLAHLIFGVLKNKRPFQVNFA